MKIPTKAQCYQLMCDMNMMDHIVVHSIQVCRVATFLAEQLVLQGYRLNLDIIRAAALLHDITKTRSFQTEENHAETGGQFLAAQGYPEIGELVRQHVRLDEYSNPVNLGEVEVINYADKRVLHDQVVSLDKRRAYILERYGKLPEHRERIRRLWQKTLDMEAAIFSRLPIAPQDLNRILNSGDSSADVHGYQQICKSVSKGNQRPPAKLGV
jgi:putative nucleotidyltransferase with HDIG domain